MIFGDSFHVVFVHSIVFIHCHSAVNIAIIC